MCLFLVWKKRFSYLTCKDCFSTNLVVLSDTNFEKQKSSYEAQISGQKIGGSAENLHSKLRLQGMH